MIELRLSGDDSRPLDLLCVGAHADDIEIGCGATVLSLLAARPVRVRWVLLSGSPERAAEARDSAAVFLAEALGSEVAVHQFTDGLFPVERADLKAVFEALKAEGDPDVILAHEEADLHQDHALVGALVRETFRDHLILGYEIPKFDGGLGAPNCFVPFGEAVRRRKVDALLEHFPSQRSRRWFAAETFDALMRLRGVECASPTGYAEAFHARKLRLVP